MPEQQPETEAKVCSWCGARRAILAYGAALPDGTRSVAFICHECDGPTLETMWGAAGDQSAIAAWVAAQGRQTRPAQQAADDQPENGAVRPDSDEGAGR
ncbi:hypothetical protein [Nocardioides bruguierae]|uniref:Uncharacterized protein n=1 Tax=Nocardioides bruguierae TaxID=2945102 RepID=A0A9X2DBH0_9ACTN|nr:hypothetical protein [Nocardioides bruguierae]MCM0622696.1 hypothetical protein [Nocardioides bruguierae]